MPKAQPRISKRALIVGGGALATMAGGYPQAANTEPFRGLKSANGMFDHTAFDAQLAKFASESHDGIVRVDYAAWKHSVIGWTDLRRYIDLLAAANPLNLSREEQFAFWTNLYNALTLDVVLAAYPVTSIRRIKPTFLSLGPWKKVVVRVAGVDLSLDAIEHGVLRRGWRGSRVHYAINCASISCPNLPLRARRGAGLSPALDDAARAYVNHPRGVRFEGKALVVSSIYKWYAADFGGSDATTIQHLASFAAEPLRKRLETTWRISRDSYDWSLNDNSVRA